MTIIFGSARISENGNAGWDGKAKAGDQTGKEVSTQKFYVSSKGWMVIRFKKAEHAILAAQLMQEACDNKNIGYDQSDRITLLDYVKKKGLTRLKDVDIPVECDCSALVRVIIYMVTGVDPGNFRTANQVKTLAKFTDLFEVAFKYTSGTKLYTGDILVTCTTGHTGMIVSGYARTTSTTEAAKKTATSSTTSTGGFDMSKLSSLKKGSTGDQVKALQILLIGYGYSCGAAGVDGDFGSSTLKAVKAFQTAKKLTVDGEVGPITWGALLGC